MQSQGVEDDDEGTLNCEYRNNETDPTSLVFLQISHAKVPWSATENIAKKLAEHPTLYGDVTATVERVSGIGDEALASDEVQSTGYIQTIIWMQDGSYLSINYRYSGTGGASKDMHDLAKIEAVAKAVSASY